jgi:hypothetical protein
MSSDWFPKPTPPDPRSGMIPDLPRFDVPAFQFIIERDHYPVVIRSVSSSGESEILNYDFLLMSMGRQSAFDLPAPQAREINASVLSQPERFQLIETFVLPNGETIRLYRSLK